MTAEARRRAEARGRYAEFLAALYLLVKGYRVVARRHRTPVGEIDLVARRGRLLCFVEVKVRPDRETALEAVGARTKQRSIQAAKAWLMQHPADSDLAIRFDVVALAPWRWPYHVQGAFEAPA